MSGQRWRRWLVVALATIVVGVSGCHRADLAKQRLAMRSARLGRTIDVIAEDERRRPRRLDRGTTVIRTALSRDVRTTRANLDEFKCYWQRDWNRWIERPPAYRQRAREFFCGNPGCVESVAVTLFF